MERKRGSVLLQSKRKGVFRKTVSLAASAALLLSMVPATALANDGATEFTAPTEARSVGHDAGVITIGTHAAAEPTAYYLGLDNTTWRASSASNSSSYSSALTDLRLGVFGSDMNESADNYLWNQFYNLWAEENGYETTEDVPVDDGSNPFSAGGIATIETYPDILLSISGTGDSSYAALIGALAVNNDDDPDNDYNPLLVPYVGTNFVTFINTTYNVAAAADEIAASTGYQSRYVTSGSYESATAIAEAYEDFYQGSQWYILSQIAAGNTTRKSIAYVSSYDTSASTVTLTATDASEFGACGGAGRPGEAIRNVTDNVVEDLESYSSSTTSYTVTLAELVELDPDYIIFASSGGGGGQGGGSTSGTAAELETALESTDISDAAFITGNPSSIVVLNSNSSESAIYIAYYLGFIYEDILGMSDMLAWYYRNLFHVTEDNVGNAISITCANISVPEGSTLTGFSENYSADLSAKFAEGRAYYEANEASIVAEWPNLMSNDYYENNILIQLTEDNVVVQGVGNYESTSTDRETGETTTTTSEGVFATVVYTDENGESTTLTEWSDYTYTYEVVEFAEGVETDIQVGATVYSIQYPGTYIMHLEGATNYTGSVDITVTYDGVEVTSESDVTRVYGENRYETMAALVAEGWTSSDTVVLVSGENWPDALSASSIAGLYDAPVILTNSTTLTSDASEAIAYLGASQVIIVGGTSAVSSSVTAALQDQGLSVYRLYGNNRVATSLAVYTAGIGSWGDTAIVASSTSFADSLSISPYSYSNNAPIFLVGDELTDEQSEALRNFSNVIIVGGTAAVNANVASSIGSLGVSVNRIGGSDRYETSQLIAEFCINNGMTTDYVGIAYGGNYPDALAGAAFCGLNNSVLLLVNDTHYTQAASVLSNNTVGTLYVMGGTSVVGESIVNALEDVL